jgi:methyltransferase (TIGR00027 family)
MARQDDLLIQHVSDTAFLVAHARAAESRRPDALFSDPLAERLAGEKGRAIAATFPPMTAWSVVMRTLVIDAFIREACDRGVRLFVNLGAGLDTRPYRLALPPDTRWLEVDYPQVLDYKERCLTGETPRCHLERIAVDLADAGERGAFLRGIAGTRMLVLTEGVVPYLDLTEAGALADDLRKTEGVEGWVVDYVAPESHRHRDRRVGKQLAKAQFKFRPDDWFGFFASHGWKVRTLNYLADEAARVRRRPPFSLRTRLLFKLLTALTPPSKRGRFRRFFGYAWMVPS